MPREGPEPTADGDAEHPGGVSPIDARLADEGGDSGVRVGSPFAAETVITPVIGPRKEFGGSERFDHIGPFRYTALGAVAASALVVGFATAASFWFPAGGAVVAALGCVLAIVGLSSSYRFASSALLAVHLCLFVVSYSRSLN